MATKKTTKLKPQESAKAAAPTKGGGSEKKRGLRGAAPWAARHAAKHAAEAKARAEAPPLPGSARATIRVPTGAEDIKAKIGELHNALAQIKSLKKGFAKTFYDIGLVLKDVQARRLYVAKGYATFDAFLEREIDFGKTTGQRLVRVVQVFVKDAALELGTEKLFNALAVLDMFSEGGNPSRESSRGIPSAPLSTTSLPLRPPGK